MSSKLGRESYEQLVAEDLAWLRQQPRTLEREHVMMIVKASPRQEYDVVEQVAKLEAGLLEAKEEANEWRSAVEWHCYGAVRSPRAARTTIGELVGRLERLVTELAAVKKERDGLKAELDTVKRSSREKLLYALVERLPGFSAWSKRHR